MVTGEKMNGISKVILYVFSGVCTFCFLFLIFPGLFSTEKESFDDDNCRKWNRNWSVEDSNGTIGETIQLPTRLDVDQNEYFRITKKLPDVIHNINCLQVRSSQEDVNIYVDGDIRKIYNDEKIRPFGKSSASATLLVPLREKDAGKYITIEAKSGLSSYSGMIQNVYIGSERGLLFRILRLNYWSYIISVLIYLIGLVCIAMYFASKSIHNEKRDLLYIGWMALSLALWLICESDMRQFYFSNVIKPNICAYLMSNICPVPALLYVDFISKGRHRFHYNLLMIGCMVNLVVCTALQLFGIADYNETLFLSHIVIVLSILMMIVFLIIDWRHNYMGELKSTVIGFGGFAVSAAFEVISLYRDRSVTLGRSLSIGILFMILFITAHTLFRLVKEEQERKKELMESTAKSQFLATMSHEIRTPINSVLGMNEMILRESNDEKILNYAENISHAGSLLLSIINDILGFSKINAGKLQIIEVNYHLGSVLNDVYQMIQIKANEKHLDFEVIVDEKLPSQYYGDEIRIKQILINLLSNAIKYTHEGTVKLSIEGSESASGYEDLKISISDTGIGIRKEELSLLFESFKRLDQEKNRGIEGTGLGLAITSGLLQAMGSKLMVESEYEKGSTFSFILHQRIVDKCEIGSLQEFFHEHHIMERNKITSFIAPDARIMVVDDNKMNLLVVSGLLEKLRMKVDLVERGEEAIHLASLNQYDIIFLDHMMPGLDGIETRKRITNQKVIIALTANAISGAKDYYLKEGFDNYLSKPILYEELEEMIRQYLPADKVQYVEEAQGKLVDFNKGLRYCNEDKKTYLDILNTYEREMKKNLESFPAYIEKQETRQYQISVHSIKSTSLTIGAVCLSEKAKKMEAFAKRNDWESILANHDLMVSTAKNVLCVVDEYIRQNRSRDEIKTSHSELTRRLTLVHNALEDFDYDAAQKNLDDVFQYVQDKELLL